MSKAQIPSDAVQTRPFAAICVCPRHTAFVKKGTCSSDELELMKFRSNSWEDDPQNSEQIMLKLGSGDAIDHLVRSAFMVQFVFRTEADRARWINRDAFEMYRDAGCDSA